MPEFTESSWFALYVKPRHEKNVAAILRGKGYEEFVPLYDRRTPSRTTQLPLFPSYVFCRFDQEKRLPILSTPGVFSIVEFGGVPASLDEEQIAALQRVVAGGMGRFPWPDLPAGRRVRIKAGPLEGVEGVVVISRNVSRLIISVDLLQRSVAVEVDRDWLE